MSDSLSPIELKGFKTAKSSQFGTALSTIGPPPKNSIAPSPPQGRLHPRTAGAPSAKVPSLAPAQSIAVFSNLQPSFSGHGDYPIDHRAASQGKCRSSEQTPASKRITFHRYSRCEFFSFYATNTTTIDPPTAALNSPAKSILFSHQSTHQKKTMRNSP